MMKKRTIRYPGVAWLCVIACLSICGCGKQDIEQSEWERLAAIRAEAEALHSTLELAAYNLVTTGKWTLDDAFLTRARDLASWDHIKLLDRIRVHFGNTAEADKVVLLRCYLVDLSSRLTLLESVENEPKGVVVKADWCGSIALLAEWLLPASAGVLDRLLSSVDSEDIAECNEQLATIRSRRGSVLRSLGYQSILEFENERARLDRPELEVVANGILEATDSIYLTRLTALAANYPGLSVNDLRLSDLRTLTSLRSFDSHLPVASAVTILDSALAGIGIDSTVVDRLAIQFVESSSSSVTTGLFAINPPDDIRIVIPGGDGQPTYSALFGAVGMALQYSFCGSRDFATRYLGDNSTSYAFGFLLQDISGEQESKSLYSSMPPSEAHDLGVRQRFKALADLRATCALFLFGGSERSADPVETFTNLISRALGIRFTGDEKKRYIMYIDDSKYADFLRGYLLAAALREKLRSDFGSGYLHDDRTGAFLISLWSACHSLSTEQLFKRLGYNGLNAGPLLEELQVSS